jgi:nitroimidazol reductase NimA-like FMN-containing flavoprotein (pyridoxamine 5'-phosphate oxidase superfamily)
MKIERLTESQCYETLSSAGFGRLACSRDDQPYIVPIYFVVGDGALYSFALPGQKIDWMRQNPRVCIEADTVGGGNDWTSVVVFGRFLELTEDPAFLEERNLAHVLLQRRPMWWEPGATSPTGDDPGRGYAPIFYRVTVESLSGYRGVPVARREVPAKLSLAAWGGHDVAK